MCFYTSVSMSQEEMEERFQAHFLRDSYKPAYHITGFGHPHLPVITNNEPRAIQMIRWGLVPHWVKDMNQADKMAKQTLNARSETIFEKPSFRVSIWEKRCLVLVDGFYEWRHLEKKKFPYFIRMKDGSPFALAGIWSDWKDPESGTELKTFSIVTTKANPLLEMIHNTKMRMPVILKKEEERMWLDNKMEKEALEGLMQPLDDSLMEAWPVGKDHLRPGDEKASERVDYDELRQSTLF